MSNFKHPAIVSLAAITGAQLSAIVLSPQPGQTSNVCLQWAQVAIGSVYNQPRPSDQPHVPAGLTVGEYNQYRKSSKPMISRSPHPIRAITGCCCSNSCGSSAYCSNSSSIAIA
ncbi:MAG: hypothetical protein KME42_19735 [Tildeniella nuda ZEHNDER 1965/U140]|jgi:hypothetical protein|nr:hypothetical protein [Tildeniella nuda ZEHNDER 1965/U140]